MRLSVPRAGNGATPPARDGTSMTGAIVRNRDAVEHIDPGVPARGLAHWSRRKNTLVTMAIESMFPEAFSGRFASRWRWSALARRMVMRRGFAVARLSRPARRAVDCRKKGPGHRRALARESFTAQPGHSRRVERVPRRLGTDRRAGRGTAVRDGRERGRADPRHRDPAGRQTAERDRGRRCFDRAIPASGKGLRLSTAARSGSAGRPRQSRGSPAWRSPRKTLGISGRPLSRSWVAGWRRELREPSLCARRYRSGAPRRRMAGLQPMGKR